MVISLWSIDDAPWRCNAQYTSVMMSGLQEIQPHAFSMYYDEALHGPQRNTVWISESWWWLFALAEASEEAHMGAGDTDAICISKP